MPINSIQSETPNNILNLTDTACECIKSLEILDKVEGFADTIITYIFVAKIRWIHKTVVWKWIKKDEFPKLKEYSF